MTTAAIPNESLDIPCKCQKIPAQDGSDGDEQKREHVAKQLSPATFLLLFLLATKHLLERISYFYQSLLNCSMDFIVWLVAVELDCFGFCGKRFLNLF